MKLSNLITSASIVFACIQSIKLDVSHEGVKFELTKTALANAEQEIDQLKTNNFGLASVGECAKDEK